MVANNIKIYFLVFFAILNTIVTSGQDQVFIKNQGQFVDQNGDFNSKALFLYSGKGYNVVFYKDYFAYEVFHLIDKEEDQYRANRIELWYSNPNKNTTIRPCHLRETNLNYYKNGKPFLNISSYKKLKYENVWEGIDIEFTIEENRLKYNFIISTEAKNNFSIKVKGADLFKAGETLNFIRNDTLIQEKTPFSFIYDGGVKTTYKEVKTKIKKNKLSYIIPKTRNGKVIIDPIAFGMKYSTYYGGSNIDYLYSIDAFTDQKIVTGGYTLSTNNIATTGAYQTTIIDFDIFIAKFDTLGSRVWGTYIGGSGFDRAYAIAVDAEDNILVSGNTMSSTGIATLGTHQQVLQSIDDGFIMKFNSLGQLLWGTYYGGNDHDFIGDLAVDSISNIYITGHTQSTDLPISLNAHNKTLDSLESAFLGVFDTTGNLIHSTYYGFGNYDGGLGIATAIDGSIFMSGYTSSSNEITYGNPNQSGKGGQEDGFLVRFSKDYTPIWGTYIGGSLVDQCTSLSLDDSLNVYISGNTSSNNQISTIGSFQDTINGFDDAFMMKFDSTGSLKWGTYIGGEGADYIQSIAYKSNNIWLAGYTTSKNNIGDSSSINPINLGNYDNLILNYDINGNKTWGTFSGDIFNDFSQDIIILNNQEIAFCGFTESINNISTTNAHQINHGGQQYDGFWTKFCKPSAVTDISNFGALFFCEGDSITVSSTNIFPDYLWSNGITTTSITIHNTGLYWLHTIDSNQCPGRSDTLKVTVISPTQLFINSSKKVLCENDSINLSVDTNLSSYLWSNGSSLSQITIGDTGKYWVQATDSFGCDHSSDTILITKAQLQYPVNAVGNTTICQNGSVILYASSLLNSFYWNTGAATPSLFIDTAGTFWFTATDSNFCSIFSDTTEIILANYPNPVSALDTAGIFILCPYDTLFLQADSGFSGYLWSDSSSSPEISITSPGVYYVIVSDSNGCTAISDTAIVNSPLTISPELFLPNGNSLCKNDSILIIADSSFLSVLWNNSSTDYEIYADSIVSVFYTAIDTFGCSYGSDTIQLVWFPTHEPVISIILPDSIFCTGQIVPLEINPQNYILYEWQNGDTGISSTFSSTIPGDFWQTVSVIDSNNCILNDSILISFEVCQSLLSNQIMDQVRVYPAIVDNVLYISSNIGVEVIKIIDESGKTVLENKYHSIRNATINFEKYSKGMYFLEIITEYGLSPEIRKIIKK